MRIARLMAVAASVLLAIAWGQIQPTAAHVNLYFPHFTDGGPQFQQWQTTFTFLNTNDVPAHVDLILYGHDGAEVPLDLGNGAASRHTLTIPPLGSRILRSRIASETVVSGWAAAYTDVPVLASVTFRMVVNGAPFLELAAQPTLPTLQYFSAAKRTLGVAVANVYVETAITIRVTLLNSEGSTLDSKIITVPPKGHTAFVVHQLFPNVPDFNGMLVLSAENPPRDSFLAWTVYENDGIMSTLPPGPSAWPIPHWDQIWLVYQRVGAAALSVGMLDSLPELKILYDRIVNAYARGGREVGVTLGLSQLISDSPSELAFALAHELGHIYQQRNGGKLEFHSNAEFDADMWGTLLSLGAGYDPYAAAGTLAKLSMATGTAGLAAQNFEDPDDRRASVFQYPTRDHLRDAAGGVFRRHEADVRHVQGDNSPESARHSTAARASRGAEVGSTERT